MKHELTDVHVTITLGKVVPAEAMPGGGLEQQVRAWGDELAGVLDDYVRTMSEAADSVGSAPAVAEVVLRHAGDAR